MDAKARKTEVNLNTLGAGVILFGAWIFIKFALSMLIYSNEIGELLTDSMMIAANIIIWSTAVIDFIMRLYIGISARSESRGKRKSCFYIVLAGIIVFFELFAVIGEIVLVFFINESLFSYIVTLIIDITSLVIMTELMISAIRIRVMRRKEAAE